MTGARTSLTPTRQGAHVDSISRLPRAALCDALRASIAHSSEHTGARTDPRTKFAEHTGPMLVRHEKRSDLRRSAAYGCRLASTRRQAKDFGSNQLSRRLIAFAARKMTRLGRARLWRSASRPHRTFTDAVPDSRRRVAAQHMVASDLQVAPLGLSCEPESSLAIGRAARASMQNR